MKTEKGTTKLEHVKCSTDLTNYLQEKAINHNNYKYYSKHNYVQSILDNHIITLSNGFEWNDTADSQNFLCDNENINFGLCLSYSKSESVAMWLLYSGNNGAMIDFDKKTIEAIIKTDRISIGQFNGGEYKEDIELLKPGFSIYISDVIYYGKSKADNPNVYYIKRSDEVCQEFNPSIIDGIRLCKKKISWSYENECRIIVSVNRKILKNYGYQFSKKTCARIEFPIEFIDNLKDRCFDSPNRKEIAYNPSKLADDINWDLCKNCKYASKKNNT